MVARAWRARPGGRSGSRLRSASRTSCRTTARRSPGASGRGRAGWSARTPRRRAGRPSRARAPARSTRAGAGRRRSSTAPGRRTGCGGRPWSRSGSAAAGPRSTRRSGATLGTYVVSAPRARANSRIPLTELWLSKVSRNRSPAWNGYASPTRRSAPVAFGVKIATYSSGEALKNSSTCARARSASSVLAAEVGLIECGLPRTVLSSSRTCSCSCEAANSPPPV